MDPTFKQVANCSLCTEEAQKLLDLAEFFPDFLPEVRYQESANFRCSLDMHFPQDCSCPSTELHFIIYPKRHCRSFADLADQEYIERDLKKIIKQIRKQVSKQLEIVSEIIFEKPMKYRGESKDDFDHAHLHLIFSSKRYDNLTLLLTLYINDNGMQDFIISADKAELRIFPILKENIKDPISNGEYVFIKNGYLQVLIFGQNDLSFKAVFKDSLSNATLQKEFNQQG